MSSDHNMNQTDSGWRKRQIADDIHSCSPFCDRPMCVAVREAVQAERKACVKECKKLIKVFLSSKYSTGQPLSSFKERHAVYSCIDAIEARGQA